MIATLRIENVALIRQAEISFGSGLNVLTGETGAGKSILVDSINFMLGERPGRDFIRSGADMALVEGLVEVGDASVREAVGLLGFDIPDGELLLQRSLQAGGKSVCRVNGRVVPVGMLKEISALLVDVHGQHEHQSLLDVRKQLPLLDQFCGEALSDHKHTLERLLFSYRENGKALKSLENAGGQQLDIWRYQWDEIQKAKLKPDEEEELTSRRARLSSVDKLGRGISAALSLLHGGGGDTAAVDRIGKALGYVNEIARLDETKAGLASTLTEASVLVADVIGELRAYADDLDTDPAALERIESRLDVLYRIKKKYGPTLENVLAHGQKLEAQIARAENSAQEIERLKKARAALTREITRVCAAMTALRAQTAEGIQAHITRVLTELGMKNARFAIAIEPKGAFGPEGNDRVEFMIAPNLGEGLKPLARIASGGEMSRVMLAVKTVLADADRMGTLIFDEIDAGVSGRTAQQVAEKLMGIGRSKQLLCITHLPQIAAMADTHFLIEKMSEDDKTVTSVTALDKEDMIQELARLIGGAQITDATRRAAREMKEQAAEMQGAGKG